MSGRGAGYYGCTERIHVAGERVLGKSQGAHGLGVMRISSHEGFSQGAKQDATTWAHLIPTQVQGSWGSPSPRHWALRQSWEEKEPRAATGWLWKGMMFLGVK